VQPQLAELLKGTITDGIRVKSVLGADGRLAWVGYGITQSRPFPGKLIPIALGNSKPRCWLHVQHTLHQDEDGYLTCGAGGRRPTPAAGSGA
jgi:hypothetical protein